MSAPETVIVLALLAVVITLLDLYVKRVRKVARQRRERKRQAIERHPVTTTDEDAAGAPRPPGVGGRTPGAPSRSTPTL